jgi:hypothetical protein
MTWIAHVIFFSLQGFPSFSFLWANTQTANHFHILKYKYLWTEGMDQCENLTSGANLKK